MEQENKLNVWMISQISAFLGEQIGVQQGNMVGWYPENSKGVMEVHLDFDKKELGFVDSVLDMKTYYSLVGVAMMAGFTTEDYFTDK